MDDPVPHQRVSVWRIMWQMAYLSVALFFAQRAIEEAGWIKVLFKAVVLMVLYLHIGRLAIPVGIVLDALLLSFFNARSE